MSQIRRRQMLILGAAALAAPTFIAAQTKTIRICALGPRKNSVLLPPALARLAELGYIQGKGFILDYRSADGIVERFPALARDLIKSKCDLVFAIGTVHAARPFVDMKTTVPVVLLGNDYDPVKAGIIRNLRRPGENITGVVLSQLETSVKRVEIMREILPQAKRILVVGDSFTLDQLEAVQRSAKALGVEIIPETFTRRPYDLDVAFEKARAAGVQAAIVLVSPVLFDQRKELAAAVAKHRLPAAIGSDAWGIAGFLFAYGANATKAFRRAGDIAASILRGTKPGDIPVEQPTEFDFVLNLKAAQSLGITIPPSVRVRADRVIQ